MGISLWLLTTICQVAAGIQRLWGFHIFKSELVIEASLLSITLFHFGLEELYNAREARETDRRGDFIGYRSTVL